MKDVRELEKGDIVRFNYGVDNFIKAVIVDTDVHQTWTKVTFIPEGHTQKRTTWLYTDAVVEWIGRGE